MKRFATGQARGQATLFPEYREDYIAEDNPVRVIDVFVEELELELRELGFTRVDNGKAIRKVCREFIVLCRRLQLFSDAVVAIDGSKFKAVNNRDRNFTQAKLKRRLEQIDESIARYLSQLDSTDREESAVGQAKRVRLEERIEKLKEEIKRLKNIERDLRQAPDQQISQTDPDARSMATSGRGVSRCLGTHFQ